MGVLILAPSSGSACRLPLAARARVACCLLLYAPYYLLLTLLLAVVQHILQLALAWLLVVVG